ncbi:TetR family transcriptional regulator [Embleya sp. NBC_00896]|uniref:TetR family transcriptional regulator n=1 Tax=Embleya sp. NBC_00896 TaxID=2975961 RepID=UPI0038634153|nr:TetR family transcriptional regulator [Embleya sp. NBC_00896]
MSEVPPHTLRTPRLGRPARLDRDRIVAAALAMDLDTLTMQALAERLGVATSALYRWVDGREELLDLVGVQLAARIIPAAPPTAETWRAWLIDLARSIHREFGAIPGFAARLMSGPHRAVRHLPIQEGAVAAFMLGGADRERAHQYWYVFATAVLGWTSVEEGGRFPADPPMDFEVLLDVLMRGYRT